MGNSVWQGSGTAGRLARWRHGVIALMAVAAVTTPISAIAQGQHAALVIDANNGNVMHADQADETRYPASLTKIMTLYLAFEAIEQGRTSYAARLKVSQEAASQAPTKLDLEPGETIALIDAMKALITKSANDAAVVIAEHLGGTEARFARMMTEKARLFGMSRTTFRNASGLPDPQQVTTARDMARLALRIQDDFPKHYQLFATRTFAYDGATYRNHNNLLHRFQGTDGIKTGYTRASGFNLVASVRRGGRHVIGVVLGGRTAARRDDAMQLLLSRALMTASPYRTRRSAPVLIAAPAQRARPAPLPEPVTAERPQPEQVALARAPQPASDVERPRPVMVPLRPRAAQQVSDAGVQWPLQVPEPVPAVRPQMIRSPAEDPPQRLAFAPRGFELAPVRSTPDAALPEPGRGTPPSTLQQQAAALPRAAEVPPPAAATAPAPRSPVPPPPSEPQRGSPPSTLQQQAIRLAARPNDAYTPPPRPSTAQVTTQPARTQPAIAALGGQPRGFEIQVGAFATAVEAERALAAARTGGGDLLASRVPRVVPVAREAGQVFRARFVGFDSAGAAATCMELRRRHIDCFVMRAE